MRAECTITLGEGRDVTVREMRVGTVRALIDWLPEEIDGQDLIGLVRRHLPTVLKMLGDCVELPRGETVETLTVSELSAVLTAWWELHQGFFDQALALLGWEIVDDCGASTSSAPASSSASTDTTSPGGTAGGSSRPH